jgi:hypothetical protein
MHTNTKIEAIKTADAHLNNAGLPTYSQALEIIRQLKPLAESRAEDISQDMSDTERDDCDFDVNDPARGDGEKSPSEMCEAVWNSVRAADDMLHSVPFIAET